jgi:hypothetical protein
MSVQNSFRQKSVVFSLTVGLSMVLFALGGQALALGYFPMAALFFVAILTIADRVGAVMATGLSFFFFAHPFWGDILFLIGAGHFAFVPQWGAYALFLFLLFRNFALALKIAVAGALCAGTLAVVVYTGQDNKESNVRWEDVAENLKTDTINTPLPDGTGGQLVRHHRSWEESGNAFEADLSLLESEFRQSQKNHDRLEVYDWQDATDYWRQVYVGMVNHDAGYLSRIVENFRMLQREKKLSVAELAKATVSCVQNIPYVLIHKDACESFSALGESYARLHAEHPCKPDIKFGLQAPAEFVYDLKGDCDTRSVMLFTVLHKMGYKVAVLNSDAYGHSILGVAMPGNGLHKYHKGVKYYVWETTAPNWRLGVLSPSMNDMANWEVVLAN